jgi:PAS domain S-box-containing protein
MAQTPAKKRSHIADAGIGVDKHPKASPTSLSALREQAAGLRRAQLMANLAHVVTASDGSFETWSETLPELIGVKADEVSRSTRRWLELVHPDDRARFRETALAARVDGKRRDIEYRLWRSDGAWIHVRQVMEPIEGQDRSQNALRWFNTLQDITAHKNADEKIRRLNRVYAVLSGINSLIVRVKKQEELFQSACDLLVRQGAFITAWIGLVDEERKCVRVSASAGEVDGFFTTARLSLLEGAPNFGLAGQALRAMKPVIAQQVQSSDSLRKKEYRERGINSACVLPLAIGEDGVGVLGLYSAQPDFFDDDELRLLVELAGDVSFAMETIRSDARRRQAEAAAARALTHDALVDLPNRPTFIRMVTNAISEARGGGPPVAVLSLHVGRLQEIFDSFGFEPYQVLIKQIAARLAAVPAFEAASARLPMEDFGLLLRSKDLNITGVIADRLLAVFKAPFAVGEVGLDVRAAVGVSFFPDHGDDGESLARRASLVAKEAFQKDIAFKVYSGAGERERPERLALAGDFRAAIDAGTLELHYQPKVRLADGARAGYEALARWSHPSKGTVPPATFIPLAEQMGLIRPMTNQVVRMAVRQLHTWGQANRSERVAVNLSVRNLHDPVLLTMVDRWLKSYGVPGEQLDFEITESALVEDPEMAKKALAELRARGAAIYIDDFGTGYSSLSYLATLPVNSLKIDRSFIRDMGKSRQAYSVVASIISMAHSLGMSVVAEGVETAEQVQSLRGLQCDEVQGYFFGKPVPSNEL